MNFRLDHLVIAVADLAQAVEDYRALGFTVQVGGRHPGRTSHNVLVAFDDGAYLEIIAWSGPDPAERWYNVHAEHGDGLMDYALIPESVPQAIADAKARGLALKGPIEGGRMRPDGKALHWQTARQATFDLPFLCGDVTPREWRVPDGAARRHANGALGLAAVAVAVHDLEASAERYRALLGVDVGGAGAANMSGPADGSALGARKLSIPMGDCAIVLISPTGGASGQAAKDAAVLKVRLDTRGEGPCGMTLRTAAGREQIADRKLTHGVPIEIGNLGAPY